MFKAVTFDLVLVDTAIPEVSGLELTAAIKRIAPGRPVILLSGSGDIMEDSPDDSLKPDLVLTKPISLAALREALAAVLGK